jgi:GT2 family glycosyltransferase
MNFKALGAKVIRHAHAGTLFPTALRFVASLVFRPAGLRVQSVPLLLVRFAAYGIAMCLYPCVIAVGTVLLVHDLLIGRSPKKRAPLRLTSPTTSSVEIVVVNWNGAPLLQQCLQSVVDAASFSTVPTTVMLVDNGSSDESVQWTKRNFPNVRILQLTRNHGFGEGNNLGAMESSADILILLNNDMIVEKKFINPLIDALKVPGTFAATSQISMRPGVTRVETGLTYGSFHGGRYRVFHAPVSTIVDEGSAVPVFWAGGGAMAVSRQAFRDFGGFNQLYAPFYWEDTDLSYRAWKAGLRVVLVPSSRVLHLHRSTTSRFSSIMVGRVSRRNEYLFTWANLHDGIWIAENLLLTPLYIARDSIKAGFVIGIGSFLSAMWRLRFALHLRSETLIHSEITDRQLFAFLVDQQHVRHKDA